MATCQAVVVKRTLDQEGVSSLEHLQGGQADTDCHFLMKDNGRMHTVGVNNQFIQWTNVWI